MAQVPPSYPIQTNAQYVHIDDLPPSQVPIAHVKSHSSSSSSSSLSIPAADRISTHYSDFFRKVTGILCVQVLLTAAVITAFLKDESSKDYLFENYWVLIVAAVVALFSGLLPMCVKPLAHKVPYNYLNLLVFVGPR